MTIDQATFDRLIADKNTLLFILDHYGLNISGVTPYGLLDRTNNHFTADDRSELHYNSFYSYSLLRNNNRWLDLDSLESLVPFNLK
jgi:hypothetical protein